VLGHDAVPYRGPLAVDVGDERVERADALRQPGLEVGPLRGGQQPRDGI
jgi:hypothetical protein